MRAVVVAGCMTGV